MKKVKKLLVIGFVGLLLGGTGVLFLWKQGICSLWFELVPCVIALLIWLYPILFILNKIIIKKSRWFDCAYGDAFKFRFQKFNTEIACLGSSPAKYAFDESIAPHLANWASAPQSILDDFRILKNYHSYLKKDAYVLLSFSQCRALKYDYEESSHFKKFHYFLHPILNPFYNEDIYIQFKKEVEFPIRYAIKHPLKFAKLILKYDVLKLDGASATSNKMTNQEIEVDAKKWNDIWMKEFSLTSFNLPLKENLNESIDKNARILCDMAEFCKERSLNLVFIVLPVTNALKNVFPDSYNQKALYGVMEPARKKYGIKIIDFLGDEDFSKNDLYFNSFFLNKKGRTMFTKKLLKELQGKED